MNLWALGGCWQDDDGLQALENALLGCLAGGVGCRKGSIGQVIMADAHDGLWFWNPLETANARMMNVNLHMYIPGIANSVEIYNYHDGNRHMCMRIAEKGFKISLLQSYG